MKYCSKCGHANADNAVFCGGCGAPASTPAGGYGVPATVAHPAANVPAANKSGLWLLMNTLCLVLFFPGSLIFNAIGIALATAANSRYKAGDYSRSIAGAKSGNKNTAWKYFIGGLLFGTESLELYCPGSV